VGAITINSRVLVSVSSATGVYIGRGVYVEEARVVEVRPGGLLLVEDEDGVRWLCGRESVVRVIS
jgi:hypothetical protein